MKKKKDKNINNIRRNKGGKLLSKIPGKVVYTHEKKYSSCPDVAAAPPIIKKEGNGISVNLFQK